MKRAIEIFAALGAVFVLVGCSGGPETGPGQVRWDKVSCERCLMAVSDRHFSAQIRGGPAERKSRLYFFDDFGCAVLWLEEQPWRNESRNEIWVTDAQTGQWLDARTARFTTGFITPMDFGLAAGVADTSGALTYEQAVQEVQDRQARHHRNGNR